MLQLRLTSKTTFIIGTCFVYIQKQSSTKVLFYPIPESQSLHTHELRKRLCLRLTLVSHGEGCGHTFDPMPESQSLHTHDGDHRSFHSTGYDWINSVSSLWDTIESLNDLESMSSYEHILLNIGTLHFSGKKKEGKKSLKIMKKRRNAF